MKIKEIMTEKVITVNSDTKITDVAKILHKYNIHAVPVTEENKLVGIISETDFFTKSESEIYLPSYIEFLKDLQLNNEDDERVAKYAKLLNAKAEDIMTKDCITLFPESDVEAMFKLVKEAKLHSVPVTDENNEIVGIITVADIIKLI